MDMREEFESAYVEEMVAKCGEGFRSSAIHSLKEKEESGEYSNPIAHAGFWAWQASRESLVIEMPRLYDWAVGEAGVFRDDDGTLFDSSEIIGLLHVNGIRTK